MKRIVASALTLLLAACAPHELLAPSAEPTASAVTVRSNAVPQDRGTEALTDIRRWYEDTRGNCSDSATLPAFLCSGVMLRATVTSPAFFPWDPSPVSEQNGGVSFSWIRSDMNFANLVFGYANGFILYPSDAVPAGKDHYQVLCVFPMDGDTANRSSDEGCGENELGGASSKPCDTQGIMTAIAWIEHFNALGAGLKHRGQCGWNVRRGIATDTAARFNVAIAARAAMPTPYWVTQDEMRIATWPQGRGATLPVRAFFYMPGHAGALANAQNDQERMRASYDVDVPILRMTLPSSQAAQAIFAYDVTDQALGPGDDFESAQLQGNLGSVTRHGMKWESLLRDSPFSIADAGAVPLSGKHLVILPTQAGTVYLAAGKMTPETHAVGISLSLWSVGADNELRLICTDGTVKAAPHPLPASGPLELTCDTSSMKQLDFYSAGNGSFLRIDNVHLR